MMFYPFNNKEIDIPDTEEGMVWPEVWRQSKEVYDFVQGDEWVMESEARTLYSRWLNFDIMKDVPSYNDLRKTLVNAIHFLKSP